MNDLAEVYQPTAADHTRRAAGFKEEALAFFHTRWETLSDRRPRVSVWSTVKMNYGESRLRYMHHCCALARAHAAMAHRLTTAGLRLTPLKV